VSEDGAARSLRVAVVGSGPAAFYAAGHLLASEDPPAEVDMLERLPTPWGLVRLGVAPDHPNLKTVSRAFERIAQRPGFRFFGNVEVGRDVTQADLEVLYDAVVYAVGAQTDRRLGIPGEDLPGSWAATEFVAWYNGHPDFQDLTFDLSSERAIVVGNGNVALDVARMLALTREELAPTDTTDQAIETISESAIREIVVLGRRGPVQAAWTSTELQEMGELAGADIVVDPAELELDAASEAELAAGSNIVQRNFEILRGFAARGPSGKPRLVRLRFRLSPVALLGEGKVEAVEVARNVLEPDGGSVRAVPTDERETIPAGIVFRSVGYHGVPLPNVPFDPRAGTIPNASGRVLDETGEPIPGLYVAGWIKRGPTGVIGTNKKDATETADLLLEDARSGILPSRSRAATLEDLLAERGVEAVMYAGWEAIDAFERGRGEPHGRPRIKLCSWDELLAAARG
jgi:ferredoxin/flavodoxin---NADP+ reductase